MEDRKHLYWKIFSSTFYLSSFTFGGGYVIIPLMKKRFVDDLKWIEEEEMLNFAAIAQSSTGAVAVNASILLGYHIAGLLGAMVAILGTILPPLIILTTISVFYKAFRDNIVVSAVLKGMQAGVAAVIVNVVINLGGNIIKDRDTISIFVMIGAFAAAFFWNINVIYIILACGCIGVMKLFIKRKENGKIGRDVK